MKFVVFSLVCLALSLPVAGQGNFTYSLERVGVNMATQWGAGFFSGTADMLAHKYHISTFPRGGERFLWGNEQYWNPAISWENKYLDWPNDTAPAFPLSKSALVWLTDGWHLMNSAERLAHRVTIVSYQQPRHESGKHRLYAKLIDIGLMSLAYSAGHITAQSIFTKR